MVTTDLELCDLCGQHIDDGACDCNTICEDDWTTLDGNRFYQSGKLILNTSEMSDRQARRAAALEMKRQQFWPNVWYVSDHGNVSPFTF